ncbi:amidase [Sphingobium sp. HWE2-09]|uniref:amidase n=1 Tax=Sphingobium sp. HWE2-09 TaxID=3108390 RepID=UPI002DC0CB85|nr:amidase [Sphingobium sp. HWE2-09]
MTHSKAIDSELCWSSAKKIGKAITDGEVSSRDVVEAHLDRIGIVNGHINAIVELAAESARKDADAADADRARGHVRGPFHGVPITIKDTLDAAGLKTTAGTIGRKDFVAAADASAVRRMRDAGAIILGKTNVPEMAGAIETDNLIYGRTNNPFDLSRTPGGSSGGDAAIIAAGGSPMSVGTDAGGSIRIPAHFCGLAAIKPTAGRVPRTGQFPPPLGVRSALFHVSLIARHVEDLEVGLRVIGGPDGRDPSIVPMPLGYMSAVSIRRLKIAYFADDGVTMPTSDIVSAIENTVEALANAGAVVTHDVPAAAAQAADLYHDISRGDGGLGVRGFLGSIGTTSFSPLLKQTLAHILSPPMNSITEALGAFNRWDMFRFAMTAYLQPYDALISPIAPFIALHHGEGFDETSVRGVGYSELHNLTGWPAVAVRVGTSPDGLPVGVQIAAHPWRDEVALAIAGHLERVFGGWTMARAEGRSPSSLVNPA